MIEIRPGTDADRPQIVARIAEVFGPEPADRAQRLWDWQWHQDPRLAAPGFSGVVADWKGQIVGTLSTIPAGLHIGGEPMTAHWCVDMLVHWGLMRQALKDHRRKAPTGAPDLSRGIATAILDHPAAGPIQLAKHISDPMMAIIERIGFTAMGDTGSLHRRVSLKHSLGRRLGPRLGTLVGAVADLALPRGPQPNLPVEVLSGGFDGRFDRLWKEVRPLYPAICLRDAQTLNWRYRQHPDGQYQVLTTGNGEHLRGYAVLLTYSKGRRRWAKLVDLLTAPGDSEAIRALAAAALCALRTWRAERVEVFACGDGIGAILRSMGFRPRLTKSDRPQPLMVRALPAAAAGIYVTQGDGDGG
ncbi:MAG TPA: hypothetical protein VES73_17975 [Lamprocystis sp. (in: g-proteobacteria)]|nr:hypothetical protein [Lamprocystis sp. (in: g-proteobacteria)]